MAKDVVPTRQRIGRPVDDRKREAILAAAANAFFNAGYDGCSIESIAGDAGVSKVTIYAHFGDKESLFRAAVEHECKRISDILLESSDDLPIFERLDAFGRQMQQILLKRTFIKFERRVASEAERDPKVGSAFLEAGPRRVRSALAQMLERARDRGELDFSDPLLAAEQFGGMVKGFADVELRFGEEPDQIANAERVASAIKVFLSAYGRPDSQLSEDEN